MEVTDAIRTAMPRLRPAEAKVGKVLLADPEAVLEATVASLADRAGVSQASVVRFTRALGLSGLPALRIELAQELSRRAVELERSSIAQGEINTSDPVADVVAKLAFHEARAIEQTARGLDLAALEQVAQAIAGGHHVVTLGVGASGLAAADLAQKLQRIGLMCLSSHDTHVQLVHAALADPATVTVAFSYGGRTVEVLRAQRISRQAGALTVAVTNDPESPIAQASQLVLRTTAREAAMRAAALASRIAQLAVVDFLFVRVAQLRFDDLGAALRATFEAVGEQHLPPTTV
ncbi:MurR/RpiR family transcriptional regulator [Micropruina sp.]|uniref:MurR/RpiR family transcriptional regulator n=1 Tax=Micropruina sp. TaxID=2737536 RepID=UPI0039E6DD4B